MNHDKDLWGEDFHEFKPIWEFVPFSGGPRICPAQQVFTHTIYLLVRLAQGLECIENCDPVFEYIQKFTLTFESGN